MLQRIRDNSVVKIVEALGYEEAARQLGKPVSEVKNYVIDLFGQHDFAYFASVNLKIRDKGGKLIPLELNYGQKKINAAVEKQRALGRPVRIKLAKARQYGGSTYIQGYAFRDAVTSEHLQFLTICHDLDSARNMRAMFDRYLSNYPRPRPEQRKLSDKWWRFTGRDIDYIIDTADELDTGRSFTIHRLHGSEVAFYRNPDVLMTAALQSVPDDPNSVIFLESTANGMGGWWYDFVNAHNDFELVFVAWWEIEEYKRQFSNDQEKLKLEQSLDAYERGLTGSFNVSLEQLNWRRYTIENKLNGDQDKFRQEYPATLEESFLTSGRPYFPMTIVRENLIRTDKIKPKTGFLDWDGKENVTFTEDRAGWWKIFSEPEEGWSYRYVTGSDPAEGKMVNETSKDPDNSVCTVYDQLTGREVARFCAKIDTDLFANEIYKASIYYKSGCDCVERNSAGIAVNDWLKTKDNVYLYRRELFAKTQDKETVEYGYQTNVASRDSLLSELRTRIRKKLYHSDDAEFWSECASFVYDEKGKPGGQRGTHDDRVFSAALAIEASLQAIEAQPILRPEEKKYTPPDADIPRKHEEAVDYAEF